MPNFEMPDIKNDEVREFDSHKVGAVARGHVERAEDRNANEYPLKAVKIAGSETARAQVLADSNNEIRPARVHTPSPKHLEGHTDETDSYPGKKAEMPDMDIKDPENLWEVN